MSARKLVQLSFFIAVALVLHVVEGLLPPLSSVPGIKLGLANVVTLFILSRYSKGETLLVLLARILLGGFFGGSLLSFLYSAVGGVCCFMVMAMLVRWLAGSRLWVCSVLGAMAHVVGQLFIAMFILSTSAIWWYGPVLVAAAIAAGTATGLLCQSVLRYLPNDLFPNSL